MLKEQLSHEDVQHTSLMPRTPGTLTSDPRLMTLMWANMQFILSQPVYNIYAASGKETQQNITKEKNSYTCSSN